MASATLPVNGGGEFLCPLTAPRSSMLFGARLQCPRRMNPAQPRVVAGVSSWVVQPGPSLATAGTHRCMCGQRSSARHAMTTGRHAALVPAERYEFETGFQEV